ncbi:MAG: hypothetical protein WCI18_02060 [Pseudomonadota bacterium]
MIYIYLVLFFLWIPRSEALPINFGISQDGIKYNQIMAKDFSIYVDSRGKHEGPMILNSLEAAKPVFEAWFEKNRDGKPLPVISSAVTSNASFANWIFDQVELQTMGQFERDLAWHEYTHSTMYLHFYNIFGPPGATLNLIWMPSWYIEGLAEALSVSSRSTTQMMYERYHALSGHWPSYDKLHALYSDGDWAQEGYPTVGSFVRWISLKAIRKSPNQNQLPAFLKDFRFYSAPWLWPWAALPFNGFMPFDRALENQLGESGAKLWEEYKKEATTFWQSQRISKQLTESKSPRLKLAYLHSLAIYGNSVFIDAPSSRGSQKGKEILFDHDSQWAVKIDDSNTSFAQRPSQGTKIENSDIEVMMQRSEKAHDLASPEMMIARTPGGKWKKIAALKGVEKLFDTGDRIAWSMWHGEDTWLCFLVLKDITKNLASDSNYFLKPNCNAQYTLPQTMNILGTKSFLDPKLGRPTISEIWLKVSEQTLLGDRFKVQVWKRNTNEIQTLKWDENADPLKIAFAGDQTWVLTADGLTQSLWRISEDATCLETLPFDDYLVSVFGLESGELIAGLKENDGYSLRKIDPSHEKKFSCPGSTGHLSPILYSLRKSQPSSSSGTAEGIPSFSKSMLETDFWAYMTKLKSKLVEQPYAPTTKAKDSKDMNPDPHTSLISSPKPQLLASTESLDSEQTLIPNPEKGKSQDGVFPHLESQSTWDQLTLDTSRVLKGALPLDQTISSPVDISGAPESTTSKTSTPPVSAEPYKWKARPALLFPWVGGDDAMGLQMGIISIPLVDSLQNETVRATVLVGVESRFPSVDVTLSSNRFKTLLSLSGYKKQTYNGFIRDPKTGRGSVSYYDEVGARFEASNYAVIGDQRFDYSLGVKGANLTTLYGPNLSRIGTLWEPGGQISTGRSLAQWRLGLNLGGTFTTEALSKNFDYNKFETSVTLSRRIASSQLILGGETSRTRGKKMPFLKELYTPLKTFIPGSGGGINQNNFALTPTNGLLSGSAGDTQGRAKVNWTIPVIESIEKYRFIFYFDRLDFTAFFNYGGAWNQQPTPPSGTVLKAAHGYNLDLQFENKGVKFTAGLGVGQLVGNPFEAFAKFSFDNYF